MTASILSFSDVLKKFRREAFSERDKGARFELLMKKYLLSEPTYEGRFKQIWLWNEFPYRKDFSGKDTGIDLVAQTVEGDYWAVQCKCYEENVYIDKTGVDSFLSTSSKSFYNENMKTVQFSQRLWISTTNHWNSEAENTIKNQNPPLIRISLTDLENSNVDWDKLVNGEEGKSARKQKKTPRENQNKAISNVNEYFKNNDRGKLIMACGCGKTYTSLKIAEKETNGKGLVLFLVPSIALLGQTLREWCAEAEKPIYPICICSDPAITKKTDSDDMSVVDLALPASTNVPNIIHQYELYDSYIKAFRWSSDRLDNQNGGIVAFITNNGWLESNGMDGFRQCLEQEFSSIHIFNLRGAIRGKSKDAAQKEGQNVFDIMTGVAITILVKKPNKNPDEKATIYYHDIGDYLKRTDKLEILKHFKGVNNSKIDWKVLKPNEHNDWLNQRSDLFSSFIQIEANKKYAPNEKSYFNAYSLGVASGRDAWVYNYSKKDLENNVHKMIDFYNEQRNCYQMEIQKNKTLKVDDFINLDKSKISWNDNLKSDLVRGKAIEYHKQSVIQTIYRPFCKEHLYFNADMNARTYQQPKFFPTQEYKNMCIAVSGIGSGKDFSTLIVNQVPCLDMVEKAQCFPLYYYEENKGNIGTLFDRGKENYIRRDGITDFILEQCRTRYGHKVVKEDIFYYVYGLLHSKDYREQFAADLKKMLPRIPLVDVPNDFWAFSKAGRELAELHLNCESVPAYPDVNVIGEDSEKYYVEKLSFGKNGKEVDKSTIIYNSYIRIENIPLEAYDYVINGKSAIEWVMDRYQVKVDKDSGIKNDPNDWGLEHNNPRYILNLILSLITVSLETVKIINNLPKLEFK